MAQFKIIGPYSQKLANMKEKVEKSIVKVFKNLDKVEYKGYTMIITEEMFDAPCLEMLCLVCEYICADHPAITMFVKDGCIELMKKGDEGF